MSGLQGESAPKKFALEIFLEIKVESIQFFMINIQLIDEKNFESTITNSFLFKYFFSHQNQEEARDFFCFSTGGFLFPLKKFKIE